MSLFEVYKTTASISLNFGEVKGILRGAGWSEDERIGLAKYIGAKIKLEKQAAKLETQRKRLDLYKGQLKLVENGTSVVENKEEAIRDLNLKIVDAEAAIRNTKAEAAKTAEEVVELKSKYSQIINLTYD